MKIKWLSHLKTFWEQILDFKNETEIEKKLKSYKKDINNQFSSKISELKESAIDQESSIQQFLRQFQNSLDKNKGKKEIRRTRIMINSLASRYWAKNKRNRRKKWGNVNRKWNPWFRKWDKGLW